MTLWHAVAIVDALITLAFVITAAAIVVALRRSRTRRGAGFAVAVAVTFLATALSRALSVLVLVRPSVAGADRADGFRPALSWPPLLVAESIVAAVAVGYWLVRFIRPGAMRGAILFEDPRQRERFVDEGLARMSQVLERLGEGFVAADDAFRITSANTIAHQLLDVPAASLPGRTLWDVLPELPNAGRATLGSVSAARHTVETTARLGDRVLCLRAFESFGGISVRVTDVTAAHRAAEREERLERELAQLRRLDSIGALAGGVAHDFNNLLTVINGTSELLLSELAANDHHRADVEAIAKAGERGAQLTRQLLTFSGQDPASVRVVDCNQVITELVEELERTLGPSIDVLTILDDVLPSVHADPAQLRRMILNLVMNARDAMPEGGQLAIQTTTLILDRDSAALYPALDPGLFVELSISDTGSGMEPEVVQRAFEPFFSTKPRTEGTGLGLADVYGMVNAANGHISIYSEPSIGTRVRIWLPTAEHSEDAMPESTPGAAPQGQGETVLVVEDDDAVRRLAVGILEQGGYRVLAAANADHARALLAEHDEVALLLSDVILPGMAGPVLAEQVRLSFPRLPVVYMSGYTDQFLARNSDDFAGSRLVTKPFTATALLSAVGEMVHTPGHRR